MTTAGEQNTWTATQRQEVAELTERLQRALAAGDDVAAGQHIMAMNRYAEIFHRLGEMTRDLHQRLQRFLQDSTLADIAEQGSPDTRQRLDRVISLTDEAAHRTLDAVEHIRAELPALASQGAAEAGASLASISAQLEAITLAQGYQDLSGQLIARAIAMIGDMEQQLVALLRMLTEESPQLAASADAQRAKAAPDWMRGQGPKVAGTQTDEYLADQDEVDDLLKSLGF